MVSYCSDKVADAVDLEQLGNDRFESTEAFSKGDVVAAHDYVVAAEAHLREADPEVVSGT